MSDNNITFNEFRDYLLINKEPSKEELDKITELAEVAWIMLPHKNFTIKDVENYSKEVKNYIGGL